MRLCLLSMLVLLNSCQTIPKEDMIDEFKQSIKNVRGVETVHLQRSHLTGNTALIKAVIRNDLNEIKNILDKNPDFFSF